MRKLYRFFWDCGRQGDVEGIFLADDELVAKCIGRRVYFGEILGKHSEVYGILEEGDLTALTDDQEFIGKAVIYGLVPTGYNPVDTMIEHDADCYDPSEDEDGKTAEFLRSAGVEVPE